MGEECKEQILGVDFRDQVWIRFSFKVLLVLKAKTIPGQSFFCNESRLDIFPQPGATKEETPGLTIPRP